MKLPARLILMITVVVAVTDAIEYFHIKQNPENLTILLLVSVIVITVIPIAVIIWVWHKRGWL